MFCSKCGANNSSEARYCNKCGVELSTITPTSSESANPNNDSRVSQSAIEPSRPRHSEPNFVIKHWRGDYSLGFSYWVIGSLLTVFMIGASTVAGNYIGGLRNTNPMVNGAAILVLFGFILVVSLWQLVGIWKSADKHTRRGGQAMWANIAKFMVVIGFLRVAGDFKTQGFPVMSEGARLLAGIDKTPAYQIRLLNDGKEIELAGGMPFGTADEVTRFLDAAPSVQVVHLNSLGGRMNEAYKLYQVIKDRNLITYTSTECLSACSIAFLAGRERYLAENGRLGFHSMAFGDLSGVDVKELNDEVRQKLKNHGVPESFIDHALSTPPKDMWFPSKDELLEAKVIDSVVDSRYFGTSGVTQWRDAHSLEQEINTVPFFAALTKYDQQNSVKIKNILVSGIQKGRTQLEIQNDVRTLFLNQLIPEYLKKAPDEELLRYWRSQIAEMKYLAKQNHQLCADLAFPQFAKSPIDLQRLLPKEVLNEDMDALADVVKGASINPHKYEPSAKSQNDFIEAFKKVVSSNPETLGVFQNQNNYKDDPASLCRAAIALYSELLVIPGKNRSAAVLRYMVNQ